ncbi:MAG TPA: hypothetical protein VL285_18765 [Bryobacteraceae bacterium]|jgi:hypothetical protein|nr:hypothetical protein [Bryobacteraceae bacterium]
MAGDLGRATALSVGLKVDSDALTPGLITALKQGQVNLATIGITCALCHSTVDDSIVRGIGKRLDGWPNRSLNVGAIIALSPAITDKSPYTSWGPGNFDPRLHAFDGRKFIR